MPARTLNKNSVKEGRMERAAFFYAPEWDRLFLDS
jgi:hypothetical protein